MNNESEKCILPLLRRKILQKKEPPSKLLRTQAAPRIRRRSDCISYVLIILLLLCNTYGKIKLVY